MYYKCITNVFKYMNMIVRIFFLHQVINQHGKQLQKGENDIDMYNFS